MTRTSSRSASPMAGINVTPMVDVMLVLLIIFMITAPILAHQVDIDLPQPTPRPPDVVLPAPVELRIVATGTLFWNGQPLVRDALEPQLRLEAARNPQPLIEISADQATPYAAVADVLAAAKRAKVHRIGFKHFAS